jgi:uncharacterized protein (TIGR02147 family)
MSAARELPRPNLFEYTDYRAFLRDYYAHRKSQKASKFSFRNLARMAGFSSPNFFKLVMDGKRNLSDASITSTIEALKLSRREGEFFRSLVHLGQADSSEAREKAAQELLKHSAYKEIHPLIESHFQYFSKWYNVAIREMVGTPGFVEDEREIARKLTPPILPVEARGAIELLLKLGLIRRGDSGTLEQSNALLQTQDEVISAALGGFHKSMIRLGADSIDRFPRNEREISSVTLTISNAGAARIKRMVQEFREEILRAVADDPEPNERIYQLNFQFFPLASTPVRKPKDES